MKRKKGGKKVGKKAGELAPKKLLLKVEDGFKLTFMADISERMCSESLFMDENLHKLVLYLYFIVPRSDNAEPVEAIFTKDKCIITIPPSFRDSKVLQHGFVLVALKYYQA